MAVGTYALTSLAKLKTYLNLSITTHDTFLEDLVDRATALAEEMTSRKLKARDYSYDSDSSDYDPDNALLDGNGFREIALPQYPVNSVATVRINEMEIDESTGVNSVGWFLDSKRGLLRLRGYDFLRGWGNIEVEYSAGFETVPEDLEHAVIEQAAWMFAQSKAGDSLVGMITLNLPDGSSASYQAGAFLPSVKLIFERYRRRFAL